MAEFEYPPVNEDKCKKIYDLILSMDKMKYVKKGLNEVTKCINKGTAKLVVFTSDSTPPELVYTLPELCEDKSIQYVCVSSKRSLGKACSIERPVIACCVYVPIDKEGTRIEQKITEVLNYE